LAGICGCPWETVSTPEDAGAVAPGFSAEGGGGLAGNPPGRAGAGRGAGIGCGFRRVGLSGREGCGRGRKRKGRF